VVSVDGQPPRAGVVEPGWFQRLQALEDAISYRRARVTAPCPYCALAAPGRKCDDHARDLELIAEYQASARDLCRIRQRLPCSVSHDQDRANIA
jgi:hypothetical protein